MDVGVAFAYLNGDTIQVKGWPTYDVWADIPPYTEPNDIYRVSCESYQFRVKPVVTTEMAVKVAEDLLQEHMFELATPDRIEKMNAELKDRLGTDQYQFGIDGSGVCLNQTI